MWLLLLHNKAYPRPVMIIMWVKSSQLFCINRTVIIHFCMLWILINIHDCTKSLTVHTSGLYVCTGKRRKILLGNEWILQLQFFFPPWIIPINFNFSLAALDRQDFPILLREIGQECCCHLQTQDYICNTHTHTFLTHTQSKDTSP